MDDAGLPITGNPSALRLDLLRPAQPFRHLAQDTPRVQSNFTRLSAMAEWTAVPNDGDSGVSLANYLMPRHMELLLTLTCMNFNPSS